jgi:hypothetical protein
MADGLTINRSSHRQVKKRALRKARRSGQFSLREDRETWRERRWRVSPARKPFAIAEEFGDAKIQSPAHCEILGLAARSGEQAGTGCGLAESRASHDRFLRRADSPTHGSTFQGAVDKSAPHRPMASISRRARLSCVRAGRAGGGQPIGEADDRLANDKCQLPTRALPGRHNPGQVTPIRS